MNGGSGGGFDGGRHVQATPTFFLVLASVCLAFLLSPHPCSAQISQVLDPKEVTALQRIAETLGKKDWNFSVDPCNWFPPNTSLPPVECQCPQNSTDYCHVISISLRQQGLAGTLPNELTELPFLNQFDVAKNYLSGPIPKEWGAHRRMINLTLFGNRLSGLITEQLGDMIMLQQLVLEANQFSGEIPPHIGNLSNLKTLILSSNNFTGKLPQTLAKLTNRSDFRINSNGLSRQLPDFIGSWTQLKRLEIAGTNLAGPIPTAFSKLENLVQLRISDIVGTSTSFPDLSSQKKLWRLILRNCLLFGHIPYYIGQFKDLRILDLSFNNLTGAIPSSLQSIDRLVFMHLTNNSLSGPIPDWIQGTKMEVDLSYNNFTYIDSDISNDCVDGNVGELLGKRIFDVYIRGKLELKDFNIKEAANGSNKATVQTFRSVNVTNSILEIHFFWAGKGTAGIPYAGTYGPLVSAISVESEFNPPKEDMKRKIIIEILASLVSFFLLMFLTIGILWKKGILMHKQDEIVLLQFY